MRTGWSAWDHSGPIPSRFRALEPHILKKICDHFRWFAKILPPFYLEITSRTIYFLGEVDERITSSSMQVDLYQGQLNDIHYGLIQSREGSTFMQYGVFHALLVGPLMALIALIQSKDKKYFIIPLIKNWFIQYTFAWKPSIVPGTTMEALRQQILKLAHLIHWE